MKETEAENNLETENKAHKAYAFEAQPPLDYRRATLVFRVLQWLVRLLLHGLFVIEVRGLENLPRQGGYILAANHLSWIDPFLLLLGAPASPKIYFIAAREDVERPAWRKWLIERAGGVIPVDRGQRRTMRDTLEAAQAVLKGGGILGIFPEGDVSAIETGRILPLKAGLGYFAAQTGAPIVPVAFSGTKELWLRKHIRMIVGQPLPGRQGNKAVAQAQTEATTTALLAILPPPTLSAPGRRQFLKKFLTELFTQEIKEHPTPN